MAAQAPVLQLNDGNNIPVVALGTGRGTAAGVSYSYIQDVSEVNVKPQPGDSHSPMSYRKITSYD